MANTQLVSYKETPYNHPVGPGVRVYRYAVGTAPGLNDEFHFFRVPKGAKLAEVVLAATDMDTNGTPTLEVDVVLTDGTTTKQVITQSAITETGGVARLNDESALGFLTTNHNFYLAVRVKVVAATFAAGTLTMSAIYTTVLDAGA